MRIVSRSTIVAFGRTHPETRIAAARWIEIVHHASWQTMEDVRQAVPKAKVLNGERVRFQISGDDYRLIVAFDFRRGIAFIKFIGTHAEYDRIDALTVSLF